MRCADPACGAEVPGAGENLACPVCAGLLEVEYRFPDPEAAGWPELWRGRMGSGACQDRSGVWRFRDLLPFLPPSANPVTLGEGRAPLIPLDRAAAWAGLERVTAQHLGCNPTGSFKDLGMTACISQARVQGAAVVACASTGNTSASMAAYAARAGLEAVLFVPRSAVSSAKLAQALDFGARLVEVGTNFDQALAVLRRAATALGWYLVNSVNPYRLEGQKTAVVELLEDRQWQVPDLVLVPGGNLGNVSALAKGLRDLERNGLIGRVPRLVVVQAQGADPFFRMWRSGSDRLRAIPEPSTRASAIRIGNPASWARARRALAWSEGTCLSVSDQEIAAAKAALAADGVGCEPASATTLAGLRQLRNSGGLAEAADAVAILTGHQLKDVEYILEEGPTGPRAPTLHLEPDAPLKQILAQLQGWAGAWPTRG
ncbi:MAG: threonine synthase [Candidatus Dormibacteria bacterium]